MAEPNVRAFWRALEQYNRAMETGDRAAWRRYLEEFVDPEIEYVNAPGALDPGTKHGHAGMNAVWENFQSAFEWMRAEVERLVEAGDRLVGFGMLRGRGRESGAEVAVPFNVILTFAAGKVIRWENFDEPADALDAAGLVE